MSIGEEKMYGGDMDILSPTVLDITCHYHKTNP